MKKIIKFFLIIKYCHCQEIFINNLKYLPKEFFKSYFYIVNYYNTIPEKLAKEYYVIDINILKKMQKENYKLFIIKEKKNNNTILSLMITKDKIVKIYHNNIKNYIKIIVPTDLKNNNKYQPLHNNNIENFSWFFYQQNNQLIIGSNMDFKYSVSIAHSNLIKSSIITKNYNQWNYIIIDQKKFWFIKNIFYKIKNNNLIIKLSITKNFRYQKKNNKDFININNNNYLSVPNILNLSENLIFIPNNINQKIYTIDNNNPNIISFNNLVLIENQNIIKNFQNILIHKDIPLIIYIIILYYNQFINNSNENDEGFIKNYEGQMNQLKNIYNNIYHNKDFQKSLDIFPTFPIFILENINYDNKNFVNYINMVLNFFYQKINEFKKEFKNFFIYNNINNIFPLINSLNEINEEIFWLMMNLISYNKISNDNIGLMVQYSYGFPSIIRDKINSYIVYNLFLLNRWDSINYLFNNNLIDLTIDFNTNFIYVVSKVFDGMIPGKDLVILKKKNINLLEANLTIKKLLYDNKLNKKYYYNDQLFFMFLSDIINLYKNYKIILPKDNENQLFTYLSYLGKLNFNLLKKITEKSPINIDLVINYTYKNNPKFYEKYFNNLKK